MRLARREYSLIRLLKFLARRDEPITVIDISETYHRYSVTAIETKMRALREAGFVKGYRGKGGGYVLCKSPSEIYINDVIKVAATVWPYKEDDDDLGDFFEEIEVRFRDLTLEDLLEETV